MGFLPASELASIQAAVNAGLDQSCTIQRNTPTRGAHGEFVDSWSAVATVNCNLAQPSQQMLQNFDYLIGALESWVARLPSGTDVKLNDRMVIGGVTMRVQVVLTPMSYATSVRVLASAVR